MSDYRRSALRCPGCNALLEEQTRAAVRVEICNGCSGLFVDWLDGEVTAVVRKVARLPEAIGPEGQGSGACPHCAIELHAEAFDGVHASVLRCGSCAGVFVPRSAFDALLRHAPERDPRSSTEPLLTRVLDALERFVTLGGGSR